MLVGMLLSLPTFLFAQSSWQPAGTLPLPSNTYSFLAATPSGDLLAATFNVKGVDEPPVSLPVYLIKNPTSPNPSLTVLLEYSFTGSRGYGGIACDDSGNIYLSGDTGDASTCFVRKFFANGQPDTSFGTNGEIKPARRCLGLDVIAHYLFLAVDWGQIQVYNASTGQLMGSLPRVEGPENLTYIRDIAVEPGTLRVLGVSAGNVVEWDGGTPLNPDRYTFKVLATMNGRIRAGEGISIDPLFSAALASPIPGNILIEVFDNQNVRKTTITTAQSSTHLVDSVVSFDGSLLFVSDIIGRKIHVLNRDIRALTQQPSDSQIPPTPSATSPVPTPTPVSGPVQQVKWYMSYREGLQVQSGMRKPMIVYFRRKGLEKCEDFERQVLFTPTFNSRAQNFICVYEDVTSNPLLAYRFGIYRVPYLIVVDANNRIAGKFVYNIDPNTLYQIMGSVGR